MVIGLKHLFFGGVHPRYNKEMSTRSADFHTILPKQIVVPLRQHIGKPCSPLVKVGDCVLRGQKIGDGDGLCVPVHASVSGTVVAIESRPHPGGQTAEAIVIDNDFQDHTVPFTGCDLPTEQLDSDTVLHTIREAGIVGMGGAAFPGNVKALSALGNIDTLIANACECEPYITADDSLLRTEPNHVLDGMSILRRILSPKRVILAVEDNKAAAVEKLNMWKKDYPFIEIIVLPTRYPQGSEKQLIQAVTGRQVPPGALPSHIGCAVFNVATFAAIYRAVRLGMPLIQRIVTVSGEAIARPQNFIVPIGTPFRDVIEAAGGLSDETDRVINGGPMMGVSQSDLAVPVVKATNSVLCLKKDKNTTADNLVCIRCGKCLMACPMKLQPLYIYRYAAGKRVDELKRYNVTDCMECGCCSFTCPAKLPLVEHCRLGKQLVKESD